MGEGDTTPDIYIYIYYYNANIVLVVTPVGAFPVVLSRVKNFKKKGKSRFYRKSQWAGGGNTGPGRYRSQKKSPAGISPQSLRRIAHQAYLSNNLLSSTPCRIKMAVNEPMITCATCTVPGGHPRIGKRFVAINAIADQKVFCW